MSLSSIRSNRWVQLSAGILAMVAVANFQYAWTLFDLPLQHRHGWSKVAVGDAYAIYFLLSQTWLVPFEAFLADRFGARRLLFGGGTLVTLGWVVNSQAETLTVLNLGQFLSGTGSGIVYAISVGNALKWFPDRRGLAAGLTAAAFGAGSAATVMPIRATIAEYGYEAAFLWFGLAQGLVIVLAALVMRFPDAKEIAAPAQQTTVPPREEHAPASMLRRPAFWLLYAMMTVGAVPGLLMTGKMAAIADDFGVAEDDVSLFGLAPLAALPLALMVDRLMGGFTRPLFGWISDHIGRERAIFLAFTLEGASLYLLVQFRHDPVWFVVTSGVAFFGWGAIFSLFPAASADMFGRKYATTNYGLLYTAKGAAAILVSLCNRLQAGTESWIPVFTLMIVFDVSAALLALFVLPRLRQRLLAGSSTDSQGEVQPAASAAREA